MSENRGELNNNINEKNDDTTEGWVDSIKKWVIDRFYYLGKKIQSMFGNAHFEKNGNLEWLHFHCGWNSITVRDFTYKHRKFHEMEIRYDEKQNVFNFKEIRWNVETSHNNIDIQLVNDFLNAIEQKISTRYNGTINKTKDEIRIAITSMFGI